MQGSYVATKPAVAILILALIAALAILLLPGQAEGGVDRDGETDLVFANIGPQFPHRLCLGDGARSFDCSDWLSHSSTSVEAGDLDGDGITDVAFGSWGSSGESLQCLGDGVGGFSCTTLSSVGESTSDLAFGDVDNDGDLDVIMANARAGSSSTPADAPNDPNRICLSDGFGGFSCTSFASDLPLFEPTKDVAMGDVNGDGNLDAVFANGEWDRAYPLESNQNSVCLGDGAGGFTCTPVSTALSQSGGVALGDVNGDGHVDAVFANIATLDSDGGVTAEQNTLCVGDGTGSFVCQSFSPDANQSRDIELADMNGDGFLDAVFANGGGPNQLCVGNGTGEFQCSDVSADGYDFRRLALGDIDVDGHMDAAFATYGRGHVSLVCYGDGGGGFACSEMEPTRSYDVVIVPAVQADAEPPVVSGVPDRAANGAGWYNGPVTIDWQPVDPEPSSGTPTDPPDTLASTEGAVTYVSEPSCDPVGNCATGSLTLQIDATPPVVGTPVLSVNPRSESESSVLSVGVADELSGVVAGEVYVVSDPGVGNAYPALFDGATLSLTVGTDLTSGVYEVGVRAVDAAGNWSDTSNVFLVVYDPDGGFVTGGGWIDSPEGAYKADPSMTGKATFGFVSKYKNGASVPTGNTVFQFHAGDLNFKSTSYDWLVVTGSNYARYKGVGTINGSGEYKFMIWAGDTDPDTFRIKIWAETVVYDNGMDQEIGAGSIIVHTKK